MEAINIVEKRILENQILIMEALISTGEVTVVYNLRKSVEITEQILERGTKV